MMADLVFGVDSRPKSRRTLPLLSTCTQRPESAVHVALKVALMGNDKPCACFGATGNTAVLVIQVYDH